MVFSIWNCKFMVLGFHHYARSLHLLVNISIDSSYPEYHDSFRGKKGAWEKSCNLIRILADNGILVRVAMSVTPQNMFDVENTVKMVKEWGGEIFCI